MKFSPRSTWFILGFPFVLVAITALVAPHVAQLPEVVQTQMSVFPYLAIIGTGIMGSVFRRYRFIYLAILLGISYWNLQLIHAEPGMDSMVSDSLYGLFLALNILLINFLPEKRLFTLAGLAIFGGLVFQLLLGKWLSTEFNAALQSLFTYELDLLIGFVNNTGISTIVLLAYIITAAVLLFRFAKTRSVFESGFLGALIATAFLLSSGVQQPHAGLFMLAAGLIAIGALVQNSYFIAYIDELTELPGRRALNEELSRLRGQYAIAMLDVDHFKKFNDTYGHDLGDQVLRMVASRLSKVSGGGKAFRYGGEEFCVIYPGKDMKAAFPFLSAVRQAIDDTKMIIRNKDRPDKRPDIVPKRRRPVQEVHVTISIGVAERGDALYTPEDVIKAADKALYVAKEKGRNRISQYGVKLNEVPIRV